MKWLSVTAILSFVLAGVSAQNAAQLKPGDPPVASLIQVSAPDAAGIVTISGAPGAVFPGGAIRNLYTDDLACPGGHLQQFRGGDYGPGNAVLLSPTDNIPNSAHNRPDRSPAVPARCYAPFPQSPAQTGIITQIIIDGDLGITDISNAGDGHQPIARAFANGDRCTCR
jgi:hypothetical protein